MKQRLTFPLVSVFSPSFRQELRLAQLRVGHFYYLVRFFTKIELKRAEFTNQVFLIGLKHLERCEHLVNRHLSMPCVELSDAQIDVWRCLWLKFGSMKLVKLI